MNGPVNSVDIAVTNPAVGDAHLDIIASQWSHLDRMGLEGALGSEDAIAKCAPFLGHDLQVQGAMVCY
jgi:hypothetical protein